MKIKILAIIIGSVLFVAGGMIGFVLSIGQRGVLVPGTSEPLTNQERKIRELLGHPGLDNVCANLTGEVTEIIENVIVITYNQKLLELRVEKDAHIIYWIEPEEEGLSARKERIELAEIQKGEQVFIYAAITEEGELVARGITVNP